MIFKNYIVTGEDVNDSMVRVRPTFRTQFAYSIIFYLITGYREKNSILYIYAYRKAIMNWFAIKI
jgi:hypothetical protein